MGSAEGARLTQARRDAEALPVAAPVICASSLFYRSISAEKDLVACLQQLAHAELGELAAGLADFEACGQQVVADKQALVQEVRGVAAVVGSLKSHGATGRFKGEAEELRRELHDLQATLAQRGAELARCGGGGQGGRQEGRIRDQGEEASGDAKPRERLLGSGLLDTRPYCWCTCWLALDARARPSGLFVPRWRPLVGATAAQRRAHRQRRHQSGER